MGDISREPLSTGPSPRGKRRKGPAEVIRLEEISIEETSIDEAPAPRGPAGTARSEFGESGRVAEDCAVEQAGADERDPEADGGSDGREERIDASGELADGAGELADAGGPEADQDPMDPAESTEIVVRPRPELAAALEREGVDAADDADSLAARAVPEIEQLVSDDADEQIAEPMLAEPMLAEPQFAEESEAVDSELLESEYGESEPVGEIDGEAFGDAIDDPDAADGESPVGATSPLEVPAELPLGTAASVPGLDDDAEVPELTEPGALSRVLVAVLLTAREPMKAVRLAEICNSSQKAVEAALERLDQDLRAMGMPLEVVHAGETIRLGTSPEVFPYLVRLRKARKAERLSPAALETLAVIAYQQPVIRLEIEAIRGVKVGPMLKSLLDHKLVKVVGRADVPGRPLQYGTTQVFLERFGLRSLKDLPSVQEFRSLG